MGRTELAFLFLGLVVILTAANRVSASRASHGKGDNDHARDLQNATSSDISTKDESKDSQDPTTDSGELDSSMGEGAPEFEEDAWNESPGERTVNFAPQENIPERAVIPEDSISPGGAVGPVSPREVKVSINDETHTLTGTASTQATTPASRLTIRSYLSRPWNALRDRLSSFTGLGRPRRTPWGLNRFVLLIVYCLYTVATVGCYYGWPSMAEMLVRQGAFASLCSVPGNNTSGESFSNDTGTFNVALEETSPACEAQHTAVASMYPLGCSFNCVMCAAGGLLLSALGPRLTASFGQILNIFGWLLLSFSSPQLQAHIPAIVLIGASISINLLPVLGVRTLFSGRENSIMMLFGAAFSLSTVVPALVLRMADALGTRNAILLYVGAALLPALMAAAVLLPRREFALPDISEQPGTNRDADVRARPEARTRALLVQRRFSGSSRTRVDGIMPRLLPMLHRVSRTLHLREVATVPFVLLTLYRTVCNIGAGYFHQAAARTLSSNVVSAFSYILPLGCVFCILMGLSAAVFSLFPLTAFVTFAGLLMYLLPLLSSSEGSGYAAAVFMSFFVACFSSQHFSVVERTFGTSIFSIMAGWSVMISGLLGTLSSPLYARLTVGVLEGNLQPVGWMMVVLFCLQFAWLYGLRWYSRRRVNATRRITQVFALEHQTQSENEHTGGISSEDEENE